jgi:release factor glutamine methyltransferase
MPEDMPIYPPREDSEFLAKYVAEHARGRTLDLGTGSGIQAITAAKNDQVTEVVAADKNPAAVRELQNKIHASQDMHLKKISVIETDFFSNLQQEKFDTILCNPPYLPDDPRIQDIALDGGPQGHEWSMTFLEQAKHHLTPNGNILFLFSNLTNKELVDRSLKQMGYAYEPLGELFVGMFEHLYVYRIWRMHG